MLALIIALVSVFGNIGLYFYWAGGIKSGLESANKGIQDVAEDVNRLDVDNKAAHKTIYSIQESTGKEVVKIEEHLKNINGSVNRNTDSIDDCKAEINKNTERIFTHNHGKK